MTAITGLLIALGILTWAALGINKLELSRSTKKWFKELFDEPKAAAILFGILGAIIALLGYIYLHGWGSLKDFTSDFYTNLATDFISIAVTVLIIDKLNKRRADLEEKQRIIRQMASPSNEFALEAVRLARDNGWLQDGSLCGASLIKANLQKADLSNADLSGANLTSANLWHVSLEGANLSAANLRDANLYQAEMSYIDLSRATLFSADLTRADLRKAKLVRADLRGAKLNKAYLGDADLTQADLFRAELIGTRLMRTNMTEANLSGANLSQAFMRETSFKNADLTGWHEESLDDSVDYYTDLLTAEIIDINVDEAKHNRFTLWPKGFDPLEHGAVKTD